METQAPKEEFRDSISTVNKEGKRVWIYPRKPSGSYYKARTLVSYVLLLFLFGAPFIKIDGHPFLMLNILERKFVIFGNTFSPQDFYIFVLGFIGLVVSVVLFTAIYGRVFCGWICPQTVFLEMVFRKIEYFIEGDANKQRALKAAPWTAGKFFKKTTKQIIFFGLSFIISNMFLSYIIGIDELGKIITSPPSAHLGSFIAINVFSGLFYFVFAYFREQACTIVCPYGRLQSVLLDKNSLVVAYDYIRGEPRGKRKRDQEQNLGDCIDCNLCVDVCPTGIDIRNGIQLECVNCTACIDACNNVMDKIEKPRGLIRYDSQNGIKDRVRFRITPRIIAYSAVLLVILSVFTILLALRSDFSITLLRTPGTLYQDQPNNKISNIYNLSVSNKTYKEQALQLQVKNMDAEIRILGDSLLIKPQQIFECRVMVILDRNKIDDTRINIPLQFAILQNGKEIKTVKTNFLSHLNN
jgi:cytochrome c oxidase accessory protein FixG